MFDLSKVTWLVGNSADENGLIFYIKVLELVSKQNNVLFLDQKQRYQWSA